MRITKKVTRSGSTATVGGADYSRGYNTRDDYAGALLTQAKAGKLNRQARRAVKVLTRKHAPVTP